MSKATRIRIENLTRMILYMLAHRPDEFGILPDGDGYVRIKELLKALNQEPGWSHIRSFNIQEMILHGGRSLFELEHDRIRPIERRWQIIELDLSCTIPHVLYTAIRRRAHWHVFDKGLSSSPGKKLILSEKKDLIIKIGKRKDNEPVILEILSEKALTHGVKFYHFGELYLADYIPREYIAGPMPPAEDRKKKSEAKKEPPYLAGTFVLDPVKTGELARPTKGRKKKGWKESSRKIRRKRSGI
jgi:putative RNA 2'-phosphotransferase